MTPEELVQKFRAFKSRCIPEMQRSLVAGMRMFEDRIVQKYYTSRPGLNRPTGRLAGGWKVRTWGQGTDFTAILTNSEKYGQIHDASRKGDGIIRPKNGKYLHFPIRNFSTRITKSGRKRTTSTINWVRVKQVKIPIRTDVLGEFKRAGQSLISNKVQAALHSALESI